VPDRRAGGGVNRARAADRERLPEGATGVGDLGRPNPRVGEVGHPGVDRHRGVCLYRRHRAQPGVRAPPRFAVRRDGPGHHGAVSDPLRLDLRDHHRHHRQGML
ncbi:MAG: hypothetical protein AVDCRST_MAG75-2138, partial [uncultured Propionibacteriaceae bacterium]